MNKRLIYICRPLILIGLVAVLNSCTSSKRAGTLTFEQRSRFDEVYFEAIKLKALGDYTGAAGKFSDALKIDPNSHAAMYQMANLNMGMKSFHEAIYWAEKSVKYNPDYNFWYFGQLAQAYSKTADFRKSAETFKLMINKEPEVKSNYLEAGNQYINARMLKEAVGIYNTYEKKFGIDEESARKKEGLYFELGKPKEAIEAIRALVQVDPNEVNYLGLLAEAYVHAQQYEDAIKTYNEVLALSPNNGYAHFGLADVYRKLGDMDQSFPNLLKAFDDANVTVDLKIKVVGTYYVHVRTDETLRNQALLLSEKLVEVHPTESGAFLAYSDILYASGQPDKARECLRSLTKIDASDINVWRKILSIDDELDAIENLESDSYDALEFFPNHTFLYIINSFANYQLGRFEKSIQIAEQGLDISVVNKDRVDLLATLGDAAQSAGAHEKSDAAFEELLELDSENEGALNNFAYYLSLRKTRLDEALKMVKKAIALSPDQATYWDTHGWVLFQMGQFKEAHTILVRAFQKMPNDLEVAEHYAKCLIEIGEVTQGNEILERIRVQREQLNQTP